MESRGIYTLANDTVFDQCVALINSIRANVSPDIPICVIPYNDDIQKVARFVAQQSNCFLFENDLALQKWDRFFNQVWPVHPRATLPKYTYPGWYEGFVHRKFAAFDGPFETFAFYDADSLAMKPIDDVWQHLETVDLVFDDWEHAKRGENTEIHLEHIQQTTGLSLEQIYPQLHCDSFFGSHRGLFSDKTLQTLWQHFVEQEHVNWVRDRAWWSTSALFSCMTLHLGQSLFNFTRSPHWLERTGNCADADPFVAFNHVLYNFDGFKLIRRIHYMNYASAAFARLCQGEDVGIPHQELFLHYRFLRSNEQPPTQLTPPEPLVQLGRNAYHVGSKVRKLVPLY